MLLGEDAGAAVHFELAIKSDADQEVVKQAWYQLGTAYRRLHRMDDARAAIQRYQFLRDQNEEKQESAREKFRAEHPDLVAAPPQEAGPQQ
jgi:hypothetical protein